MAIHTVTTANWNDPLFWSAISETTFGHTLDFSGLGAAFTLNVNQSSGIITISDGIMTFTVGEAGVTGADAHFGGITNIEFFTTIAGAQGQDVVTGSAEAEVLVGNAGDDLLIGGAGNDTLQGNDGDDVVHGGAHNDQISGGAGADQLHGDTGDDMIAGDEGADTILGGAGNDLIFGGDGDDHLDGGWDGDGADTIWGGAGNDLIMTYGDADSLFGGEGWDWMDGGHGDDLVDGGIGDDRLIGDLGSDMMLGGAGYDIITGGEGADSIDGGDDADQIWGNAGDTIFGGEGGDDNDTLYVSHVDFITYTTAESGTITFNSGDTLQFSGIEQIVELTPDGVVDGTAGGDEISQFYMDADGEWIDNGDSIGEGDGDSVRAGDGNDTIWSNNGNDTVHGEAGDDSIYLGSGDNVAFGGSGNDTIEGEWQNDTISGDDFVATGPNLIVNGSFEDTTGMTPTGFGFSGAGGAAPGWTDANGFPIQFHNDARGGLNATDGVNWLDLEGDAGQNNMVSQTIAGVQDGQVYILRFDAADLSDINDGTTLDNQLQVIWNGDVVGTIDAVDGGWRAYEFHLIGGSGDGSNMLTFTGLGGPNSMGASLDNVQMFTAAEAAGGADSIDARHGDDDIMAGAGDDTILAGDGADMVVAGSGADSVLGGDGNDTIWGGDGDDSIHAGHQADLVYGGTGNDTINVGGGQDLAYGEDGNDLLIDDSNAGQGSTLYGGDGSDTILSGVDGATGLAAYYGDAGDDRLEDRGGTNQTFDGGTGSDTYVALNGIGNDTVIGGEDAGDTDIDVIDLSALGTGVTVTYAGDEAGTITDGTGTLTFSEIERVILTDHAYMVDSTLDPDGVIVDAAGGNDSIIGSAGNDTILGGDGNDSIDDWANDSADYIEGGFGDDTIRTGLGADTVYGGDGNDLIVDRNGFDQFWGGAGNDTLDGGASSDTLHGGTGDDLLIGGGGSGSNDRLFGDEGNDTLRAGLGADLMDGGADADTFIIENGFGNDTIVGGDTATTGQNFDTIDLSALSNPVVVVFTGPGAGTITDFVTGEVITFSGIENLILTEHADLVDATLDDGTTSIRAAGGNDTVTGGDVGSGGGYSHLIDGGTGDDIIASGAGDDWIEGADGDDSIVLGGGADIVQGLDGNDTVTVSDGFNNTHIDGGTGTGDRIDLSGLTNGTEVIFTGPGIGSITDSMSDDALSFENVESLGLTGNADSVDLTLDGGSTLVDAGAGNDTIALGGADTVSGGDGADRFVVGAGFGGSHVDGGLGYDLIDLNGLPHGVEVVFTSPGAGTITDRVTGEVMTFSSIQHLILTDHDDIVDATLDDGSTYVETRGGEDSLTGSNDGAVYDDFAFDPNGEGNDSFAGGAGNDTLWMGTDDDLATGGGGDDQIFGQEGNDTLSGDAGNDTVNGGFDDDLIQGGEGDDLLSGDYPAGGTAVADGATVLGGPAQDSFVFEGAAGSSATIILDDGAGSAADGDAARDVIFVTGTGDGAILRIEGFDYGIDYLATAGVWNAATVTEIASGNHLVTLTYANGSTQSFDIFHDSGSDFDIGRAFAVHAGNDTIHGQDDNDTLMGGAGDDLLDGGIDDDLLDGGDGADSLVGGSGADTLIGGTGNDTLVAAVGDSVFGGDDADQITVDMLSGGGNVTVVGGEGGTDDDVLGFGLPGTSHTLFTTYSGTGAESGTVTLGTMTVTFSEIETIGFSWSNDVVDATALATGIDIYTLGGNDSILGGAGDDTIRAGYHRDTVDGGAGNDWIDVGEGNDTVRFSDGFGQDTVLGGDFRNGVVGSDIDVLDFSAVTTNLTFTLTDGESGTATDSVNTASFTEFERILGGAGNDTLDGSAATGPINFSAGGGADSLVGGSGADSLTAGEGNDTIDAGAGDDTLLGGGGDDLVAGGTGNDLLTGGAGNDTFVYQAGDGLDTITDFNFGNTGTLDDGDPANNDFIDLSTFFDNIAELQDDFADDGVLNQSNSGNIVWGHAVDYSDNIAFAPGDGIVFLGQTPDGNSFTQENTGVICFTPGTLILTETGERPVESLRPGDRIVTRDNGVQTLQWCASRQITRPELEANERLRPVLIKPELIGARAALLVSPQHGVLLRPENGTEMLVRAIHLTRLAGGMARVARGMRRVSYIHLMFDAHQIIFANGAPTESFYPGRQALGALAEPARAELRMLFPELFTTGAAPCYGQTVRRFARMRDLPGTQRALRAA